MGGDAACAALSGDYEGFPGITDESADEAGDVAAKRCELHEAERTELSSRRLFAPVQSVCETLALTLRLFWCVLPIYIEQAPHSCRPGVGFAPESASGQESGH